MESPAQSKNVSILVPLDGSYLAEHAIPYGRAIAGPEGRLIFLEVLPAPEPIRGPLGDQIVDAEQAGDMLVDEANTRLSETTNRWRPVSGEVEVETRHGSPIDQILKFAKDQGSAYIVMASHGKGALRRLAFGSVADEIARNSPIPVLLIHTGGEEPAIEAVTIKRLILPMDGSELSQAAIPVAIDVGSRLKSPAIVLQAVTPEVIATTYPGTEAYYASDVYDELITQQENAAKEEMAQESAKLTKVGIEATPMVLVGSIVEAIQRVVEPGDIIIMTSHGRTGIRRFVLGSVAERLTRSGVAPVLLVPAPGRNEAVD
jgi:nucleotide-binding universal stress UspA family protein